MPSSNPSELERLHAARAEIAALRRARDLSPVPATPHRRRSPTPRPLSSTRRGIAARRAIVGATALALALAAFALGRITAPSPQAKPTARIASSATTVPAVVPTAGPTAASDGDVGALRARVGELEAETVALQRELLRLELAAAGTDRSGTSGDGAADPGAAGLPAEDTVENRTYDAAPLVPEIDG